MRPLRVLIALLAIGVASLLCTASETRRGDSDWLDHGDEYQRHRVLTEMSEPALETGLGVEAYRFTWLRSFHSPLAVRVVATRQSAVLHVTELRRAGAGAMTAIRHEVHLTSTQWSDLRASIDRSRFWHLARDDDRFGLDGADWILEGVDGFRYHIVYRWSPEEHDPFRAACLELVKVSSLPIDPADIY